MNKTNSMKCNNVPICLQVYDSDNKKIKGSKFRLNLKVYKKNSRIVLQFPITNFEITGNGAYVASCKKSSLVECLRPFSDQTISAVCNNASVFPDTPAPLPPTGFLVKLDTDGKFKITCIGTTNNFLPLGSNVMLPCTLDYLTTGCDCPKKKEDVIIRNNIELIGYNQNNNPVVGGIPFTITLSITKNKNLVTVQIPEFTFVSGQAAQFTFLRSQAGLIPQEYAPSDMNPIGILTGFNPNFGNLPYIVLIQKDGSILVQQSGSFHVRANLIPPGHNTVGPCVVKYIQSKPLTLTNYIISAASSNFTNASYDFNSIRDTHINDAFEGTVVWTWTDNSNIANKASGISNCWVRVGRTDKHGEIFLEAPVQLTNFTVDNIIAWDTAAAIVRDGPNKGNIVVSYGIISPAVAVPGRAVSLDGGKTWPVPYTFPEFFGSITGNILTVITVPSHPIVVGETIYTVSDFGGTGIIPGTKILSQISGTPGGIGTYLLSGPPQDVPIVLIFTSSALNGVIPINTGFSDGFGDNGGVQADKFGNIWYNTTNFFDIDFNLINQPVFAASSDGGITYTIVYLPPLDIPGFIVGESNYDFPQYCFGGSGSKGYGLWFCVRVFGDTLAPVTGVSSSVGFIPIFEFARYGIGNTIIAAANGAPTDIAASCDGRVWYQNDALDFFDLYGLQTLVYKSPGPIDQNYSDQWELDVGGSSTFGQNFLGVPKSLPPVFDGAFTLARTIIYDDKRKALYSLIQQQFPQISGTQTVVLWLSISRNNGQTWSDPVNVNNSNIGNRFFASMALDVVAGNLLFGFYDGRNDPTNLHNLDYFAAILPACELNRLVENIVLSDPKYVLPAVDTSGASFNVAVSDTKIVSKHKARADRVRASKK